MMFNKIKLVCLMVMAGISLLSCDNRNSTGREFAPNMYYSAGYEPMSQLEGEANNINPYGMNMRLPVKGTVARRTNQKPVVKNDSTVTDLMIYNLDANAIEKSESLVNPIVETEQSLAEGQLMYERFCLHCHGEGGKGDGPVAKMYKGVPVYSSDALKNLGDGHIFHVITHGKGRMWPHGSQIAPADRWKIVQYVHKLQAQ